MFGYKAARYWRGGKVVADLQQVWTGLFIAQLLQVLRLEISR